MPDPPLVILAIVVPYGLAANLFYSGGWVCELLTRRVWPSESESFGTMSFALGLVGSVLLTIGLAGLVLLGCSIALILAI